MLWVGLLLVLLTADVQGTNTKKNVLMIISDDFRPDIAAFNGYGTDWAGYNSEIKTPNLDALAKESLVLRNAYCQQAVCTPSRASFFTSRRPDTTRVYSTEDHFRTVTGGISNATTLPQYFQENLNYKTVGMGKTFHVDDAEYAWSSKANFEAKYEKQKWNNKSEITTGAWRAVTKDEIETSGIILPDQNLTLKAISELETHNRRINAKYPDERLFMVVGFGKPHLPIHFPAEYWDLYDDNTGLPSNHYAPTNLPDVAWSNYNELRGYGDMGDLSDGDFNETLPDDSVIGLRKAYFSAVSYIDGLVGEILDSLAEQSFADDTIVIFMGDHGWHLGDNGEYAKQSNFEKATRVPLMINIPGVTDQGTDGIYSNSLVELVDLLPTIAEAAAGETIEQCSGDRDASASTSLCTEGVSILDLIDDETTQLKSAARSQYSKTWKGNDVMGYSIRTEEDRYTLWVAFDHTTNTADFDTVYGEEFYIHTSDNMENENVADSDDTDIAKMKIKRKAQLLASWTGDIV